MSREHNDANILALGERVVGLDLAWILLTLGSKLSSREEDMPPGLAKSVRLKKNTANRRDNNYE